MATIWDADILISASTQITEAFDRGQTPSRTIKFHLHDLLKSIRRPTGGEHYLRIRAALERLTHTAVCTNIRGERRTKAASFHWLEGWPEVTDEHIRRNHGYDHDAARLAFRRHPGLSLRSGQSASCKIATEEWSRANFGMEGLQHLSRITACKSWPRPCAPRADGALERVQFYTGVPSAADHAFWHAFLDQQAGDDGPARRCRL